MTSMNQWVFSMVTRWLVIVLVQGGVVKIYVAIVEVFKKKRKT